MQYGEADTGGEGQITSPQKLEVAAAFLKGVLGAGPFANIPSILSN